MSSAEHLNRNAIVDIPGMQAHYTHQSETDMHTMDWDLPPYFETIETVLDEIKTEVGALVRVGKFLGSKAYKTQPPEVRSGIDECLFDWVVHTLQG